MRTSGSAGDAFLASAHTVPADRLRRPLLPVWTHRWKGSAPGDHRKDREEHGEGVRRSSGNRGQGVLKSRTGSAIVRAKDGTDIVTDADEASERFIREEILRRYPDHRVLGEEYGSNEAEAEWEWVIDPLDSTVNFAALYFSVSIAPPGASGQGAVYRPFTGELFLRRTGRRRHLNSHPVHVSRSRAWRRASSSSTGAASRRARRTWPAWSGSSWPSPKIRCHGSAALDLCSIAAGQLEAFVHPRLMPWDFAAGQLIVEEAGGRVTTLEGAEGTLAGSVLATNGEGPRGDSRLAARLSGNTTAPPGLWPGWRPSGVAGEDALHLGREVLHDRVRRGEGGRDLPASRRTLGRARRSA